MAMNEEYEVEFNSYQEELFNKAINGESLNTDEWETLVQQCRDFSIDEESDDDGYDRWVDYVTVIFKYKGKYYGITYGRGKTECQDDEYYACSLAEYHKVTKTIEVWERNIEKRGKNDENN